MTLGSAADAYLATLRGAEQESTRRVYGRILWTIAAEFRSETALCDVSAERFAAWFTGAVGRAGPVDVKRSRWTPSARPWPTGSGRAGSALTCPGCSRPKPRPDRARALSRADVEQLLTREDIGIRERALWRMLYETAARSAELLALDVEDLDLPNR